MSVSAIREREGEFIQRAIERWSANSNIQILGNRDEWRLSIVSFVVRYGTNRYLHHNFVASLLSDLFGIQARAGCSCAGPYGHRLLGIDLARSKEFEREIVRGCEGIKPGWVRVNFNYFLSDAMFEFLLKAVEFVATDGWKFLVDYRFVSETGLWHHLRGVPDPAIRLADLDYSNGALSYESDRMVAPESAIAGYLDAARPHMTALVDECRRGERSVPVTPPPSSDFEALRWFPLPEEAFKRITGIGTPDRGRAPSIRPAS